jgi:hypothetical protein
VFVKALSERIDGVRSSFAAFRARFALIKAVTIDADGTALVLCNVVGSGVLSKRGFASGAVQTIPMIRKLKNLNRVSGGNIALTCGARRQRLFHIDGHVLHRISKVRHPALFFFFFLNSNSDIC